MLPIRVGVSPSSEVPGYALGRGRTVPRRLETDWPPGVTREWAWGGSQGEGVRVCVIDSGVDGSHPFVGGVGRAVVVSSGADGSVAIEEDTAGDASGHGTACAGVIRQLAPACELASVRVLGPGIRGAGADLLAGLRWAIDEGFDVVNLSLSTTHRTFVEALHELADRAYFRRCILVAAAHNLPVDSWPWRFASVVSVAAHDGRDPLEIHHNPEPPVEFLARGVDVEIAWAQGATIRASGNSFAAPHVAGLCARMLAKHPWMTPPQLKSALQLTATGTRTR